MEFQFTNQRTASVNDTVPLASNTSSKLLVSDTNHNSIMSNFVTPLLTDQYQLNMAYAYWKLGVHERRAEFEMFFRKNPFKGEFTIFAGLSDVLDFVDNYKFGNYEITVLKKMFPTWEQGFLDYLQTLSGDQLTIRGAEEGSVVFPKTPLIQVSGPLALCQLMETTMLNLCGYPSLVATNAARMRLRSPGVELLEFGLRRAQGPDGGMSASRYSYLGGFDGTSNVLAGALYGIPTRGTHAHSFVTAFTSLDDLPDMELDGVDFKKKVLDNRTGKYSKTNSSELAAFIGYAWAYPDGFLALVDTYNTLESGIPNFMLVASVLEELGHKPLGIRLDSGDLAYLSIETRKVFGDRPYSIVASNDIDENVIIALNDQKHRMTGLGIGTNLVTCKKQPALGMVFKLVEIDGISRIKLSEEMEKMTIPGSKNWYRLHGTETPLVDLLADRSEEVLTGESVLCHHPSIAIKRANVTPTRVIQMNKLMLDKGKRLNNDTLDQCRERCKRELLMMREDHLRFLNPTNYKVSITVPMLTKLNELWKREAPIANLS